MSEFDRYIFLNPNRRTRIFGTAQDAQAKVLPGAALVYKDLQFYCGNQDNEQPLCCFNHVVGLPVKNKLRWPIHDYEMDLLKLLDRYRYVWLKKARGLGITEFFLRYLCWLGVCKNEQFKRTKFFIVCGPREETAIELVKRVKTILQPLRVLEETPKTIAEFLDIRIESFPSHHVNTMRGFTDVSFILIDEADFFRLDQQRETRDVAEGYIAKTDPWIVMISTPNIPGGMFEQMENDDAPDFIYHRVQLPYTVGLGKIYTEQEIAEARRSPSFEREYNLQYGYGSGNVFRPDQIDFCTARENQISYEQLMAAASAFSVGIDPGFGSSKFAISVMTMVDGRLHVVEAIEFERADIHYMTETTFAIINKYEASKVFVDASAPGLIKDIKIAVRENPEYEKEIVKAKKEKVAIGEKMRIIPVNFLTEGRGMLMFMMSLVSSDMIRIDPRFGKLIQQMRIAKVQATTGKLDKDAGNTMDSLDAAMLAAWLWKFQ